MIAARTCLAGSSYSAHTVKAFIHDITLLARWLGLGRPIGETTARHLERFLAHLKVERGTSGLRCENRG